MFVTIEGIDGSGKTTLAQKLYQWLSAEGYDVLLTREPGGAPATQILRQLILSNNDPLVNAFLFFADRAEHVSKVILPALESGKIVICDRFFDSTIAYGGYGFGLPLDFLTLNNEISCRGVRPDITILLDIEPSLALSRVSEKTVFESMGMSFYERVRKGYLELAKKEADRIVLLDAARPPSEILNEAKSIVNRALREKLRYNLR